MNPHFRLIFFLWVGLLRRVTEWTVIFAQSRSAGASTLSKANFTQNIGVFEPRYLGNEDNKQDAVCCVIIESLYPSYPIKISSIRYVLTFQAPFFHRRQNYTQSRSHDVIFDCDFVSNFENSADSVKINAILQANTHGMELIFGG